MSQRPSHELKSHPRDHYCREFFDAMAEGVCEHEIVFDHKGKNLDYRILNLNKAFEALLGLSRAEIIGKLSTEIYGVKEAPFLDTYSRVARTGESIIFEDYFPLTEKYFSISVFSNRSGFCFTIFRDISEEKLRTKKIIHINSVLRALRNVDNMIMKVKDRNELITRSCKLLYKQTPGTYYCKLSTWKGQYFYTLPSSYGYSYNNRGKTAGGPQYGRKPL